MIASERGLAGLGFILTVGVGCSMLTALVLLPAVLTLIGKRTQKPVVLQFQAQMRHAA
jgi:predicted RND superfamily exporter protein